MTDTQRRSYGTIVAELGAAIGLLVVFGGAVGYVVDSSSTAAHAKEEIEQLKPVVNKVANDVEYIRGRIDGKPKEVDPDVSVESR